MSADGVGAGASGSEDETPLDGGNMSVVSRMGDEVRRPLGSWSRNVHALLDTLRQAGIAEVPHVLGFTADGRERLSFIEGDVGHYPLPDWLWSDSILDGAGRLLRRIHDASMVHVHTQEGWRNAARDPVEVVCHNDFAPYNLVFRDGAVVGIIDFDEAAPGPRLWDLAYLAYRLVPFAEDAAPPPSILDAESARLDALMAAYGTDADHEQVRAMMAERLDALAAHSRREASRRPELLAHALMYERDAARLRARP